MNPISVYLYTLYYGVQRFTTTTTTSNSGQGSPLCPHLNNYTLKTQMTLNKTSASDAGQTGLPFTKTLSPKIIKTTFKNFN